MGLHKVDIFCRVVDNYGDAGIAWRLAYSLSYTYGFDVRLFIDNITPLEQLAPDYLKTGIKVCSYNLAEKTGLVVADLIIECLGAAIPDTYVQAIVERTRTDEHTKPIWIRYEYLTAENWAADIHGKSSLHPQYPELKRFFFAPGFKDGTGGLLFPPQPSHPTPMVRGVQTCLLFTYPHPALKEVHEVLSALGTAVDLPPGPAAIAAGLTPTVPFRPQSEIDQAWMHYDYVFVRGEDSLTQAVAAGIPAIWHIYPQDDHVHFIKLNAFLGWYLDGPDPTPAAATRALYGAWNTPNTPVVDALTTWLRHLPALTAQAQVKAAEVRARGSACKNLVDFVRTIG